MNVAMQDSSPRVLSVPGLRGMVPRSARLRYQGFDQYGRSVRGFHARVVQHEYDYLQGILYPMRITGVLFPGQAPMDE